jgi:hypothetical protein
MSPYVEGIGKRLREAERDVLHDVEMQRRRWHYRVRRGRAWFDKEALRAHRRLRQSIPSYIWRGSVLSLLTSPIIYSLLVPLILLDVWVWTYQWICFPIYGIARVPRHGYFVMDRRRLAYLNAIEKVNCTFCSYANGLFAYVREVAARTEQYWCPIKHARPVAAPHQRYHAFFDYGDAEGYRRGLVTLRRTLPHRGVHGRSHRTRLSPATRAR